MSHLEEIRALLNDPNRLRNLAKGAFDAVDQDSSGFIEESELHTIMTKVAKTIGAPAPSKQQVKAVLIEIDANRDGQVGFDEYLTLVRKTLQKIINAEDPQTTPPPQPPHQEHHPSQEEERSHAEQERLHKQVQMFEKYLEDSGITMAFQIIFAEIITKKVEPANVFTYTAMRLRQIGKEIAHLLPKNLTAGLAEGN